MDQEKTEEIVEVIKKPKNKHKFLKKLLIFVAVLGVIILILGFIFPGLLWTKSLGVTYTKADYKSMMDKLAYVKDETPKGTSKDDYTYTYGEIKHVEVEFTSEELTAFLNEGRPDYYAIKKVQVKINKDGSIEAVASTNVDYILEELLDGKYTRGQIKKEIPALGILPNKVNLYLKFDGSVTNNIVNTNISALSVQGIPIPSNIIKNDEGIRTLTEGLNNSIAKQKQKSGANYEKAAVENSKIIFKGDIPSSLTRVIN